MGERSPNRPKKPNVFNEGNCKTQEELREHATTWRQIVPETLMFSTKATTRTAARAADRPEKTNENNARQFEQTGVTLRRIVTKSPMKSMRALQTTERSADRPRKPNVFNEGTANYRSTGRSSRKAQ